MIRSARLLLVVVAAMLATGCLGSVDRAEFDEEVRRRGGGVSADWIDESLAAAAVELGVADPGDIEVLTMVIVGDARSVTVTARRGDRPDFVDSIAVQDTVVVSTAPVPDADELPLDEITTRLSDLPLDRIEQLSDVALEQFGPDAYVTRIAVGLTDGEPTITVSVGSPRQTGQVVLDADGEIVEVVR